MNILFILPSLPFPPGDGAKVKIFNIIKYLSVIHRCDLVCFGNIDHKNIEEFRLQVPKIGNITILPKSNIVWRSLFTLYCIINLYPLSFAKFHSFQMSRYLRKLKDLSYYDIVHFDIINMAPYRYIFHSIPTVHSPNDATSLVYRRNAKVASNKIRLLYLRYMASLFARYEALYYPDFTIVHVVSDEDREYLNNLEPSINIKVIPITSGYSSNYSLPFRLNHYADKCNIAICGNLFNPPVRQGVIQVLEYVLPRVCTRYPMLNFTLLGGQLPASIRGKLKNYQNIHHIAWVDNFEKFLSKHEIIILPDTVGAPGAKTRTVQAMASGCVVVGSVNSFEGLPIVDGVHGFIYDTNEKCIEVLLLLLSNRKLRIAVGDAAADMAGNLFSFEYICKKFELMYLEALQNFEKQKSKK